MELLRDIKATFFQLFCFIYIRLENDKYMYCINTSWQYRSAGGLPAAPDCGPAAGQAGGGLPGGDLRQPYIHHGAPAGSEPLPECKVSLVSNVSYYTSPCR